MKREGAIVGSKLRTNKKCGLTLPIVNIIRSQSLFGPLGIFANCVGEQIQGHRTQLLLRHVVTPVLRGPSPVVSSVPAPAMFVLVSQG